MMRLLPWLHAASLMALASHLVREIDSAEDLVQTTYLVAIERAQAYDPDRDIYPWLAGILVNKARQWNRRTDRTVDYLRWRFNERSDRDYVVVRDPGGGAVALWEAPAV